MFSQLISLLSPCLKYCICPTFFISVPLHLTPMYIHTRTYWNVSFEASPWQCFVLILLFVRLLCLFVCFGEGSSVGPLILIYSTHLHSFGVSTKFWFQGPNSTNVWCGLLLKSSSAKWKSGTRSSFGHTNSCCVYTGLESVCKPEASRRPSFSPQSNKLK